LIVTALRFPSISASKEGRVYLRGIYTAQIENNQITNTDSHYISGIRLAWISNGREDNLAWSKDLMEMHTLSPISPQGELDFQGGA
jgi:hypothetical protein